MSRIKMVIEYDGSLYHGFQIQANAHTIQAEMEEALLRLTGERISITAAGRTDTGVHAAGQVIAIDSELRIPPEKWGAALNSCLPPDIRVLSSEEVSADFHPRFDAVRKKYAYLLYRQRQSEVFLRNYAWCNDEKLDIEAMKTACGYFVGTHNFKSFCAAGSAVKNYERRVESCLLHHQEPYLNLEITAAGFLYNMIRIIMGTLVEVGRGRYPAAQVEKIMAARDRKAAGVTAPPQGLYLLQVDYSGE
jgi:tRNA pseudouridine38-40 synthase